jgi:glycosyltransferase involved in cell wall biosynthesis
MMKAWRQLRDIPLKIRGDGRLLDEVGSGVAASGGAVELAGRMTREELARFIKKARFLVWPSEGYYESFGLIAVEAFASGVPVIAARTGVMEEIVTDGVTGIHFRPGDPDDLAAKARWAWEHPDEMARMGLNARAVYEKKYTAETNYGLLMEIYDNAIAGRRLGRI